MIRGDADPRCVTSPSCTQMFANVKGVMQKSFPPTNPWSRFWWAAAVVLTLAVAGLSLGPQPNVDVAEGISDKALHAGFYAALTGAYLAAVRTRAPAILLAVFAYGGLLELLQIALPERSAEALDLAANAAGVLAAALCTLAAGQLRSRQPEITAPRRRHGTP